MRNTRDTLAWLHGQHDHATGDWKGMCLALTHTARDIGALWPNAWAQWLNALEKHPFTSATVDWSKVPPGAPLFYQGGSQGFGHVATFVGVTKVGPLCWSNDASAHGYAPGQVNMVSPLWFEKNWGLRLVGGTNDLSGVDLGLNWAVRAKFPLVSSSLAELSQVTNQHPKLLALKAIKNTLQNWFA